MKQLMIYFREMLIKNTFYLKKSNQPYWLMGQLISNLVQI